MKGNKKILVIAILLLLITVGFTTYAIYRSSVTASGTVGLAAWEVKIEGNDVSNDATKTLTLNLSNVNWTSNPAKVTGKIAPGATGTITIPVDASGSEVDVIVTASLGTLTLPDGMTVALASGSDSQKIGYAATMTGNVVLNVTWTGTLADTTAKDTTDITAAGTNVTIPLTLTARQALAGE